MPGALFKIKAFAYFLAGLTIFLSLPRPAGGGSFFYEDFSTDQKKAHSTADWDTENQQLLLPTIAQKPLEDESYNADFTDAQERGYRFRVLYDGKITALGRYRADNSIGNTTVRLWDDDGVLLTTATVDDTSGWSFKDIDSPIKVSSGSYYRVSVICESEHAAFNTSVPVRKEYVQISSAVRSSGSSGFPDTKTDYLTGVPDIEFVSEYIYPSTGVSAGYDTKVDNPLYLDFTSSYTLNGGTVNYFFSASPDNSSWSPWRAEITELSERYLRWKAVLDSTTSARTPVVYSLKVDYNCPPEKPDLESPADETSLNILEPEFVWKNSFDLDGDTLTYTLEISTDAGFSPVHIRQADIPEGETEYSSFTVTEPLYHSQWHWRVAAADMYSTSPFSDPFRLWVDTVPPNTITDLSAERGGANREIDIQWTEPSDSGRTGAVSEYAIRYATYTLSEERWLSAAEISPSPNPTQPDDERNYTITGLEDDTFYHLAVKTADEAGNWSEISNVAVSSTNFTPEIELEHPTGEEVVSGTVTIRWRYSDVNADDTHSFDVLLSDDGGDTYAPLASSLPDGTTFYLWDTTLVRNEFYRIKVVVEDNMGLSSADTSGEFTVDNENEPPSVELEQPDGGETFSGSEEIIWEYEDPNPLDEVHFDIFISSTAGAAWIQEAEDLYRGEGLNSGTTNYLWDTTSYPDGNSYLVKIVASDGVLEGEAVSSSEFIVWNVNHPPEDFSLISPEPAEEVKVLRPAFNWEDSDDPDIPLGDSFTYSLFYSETEDFAEYTAVEGIAVSSYTLTTDLEDNTEYFWKVKAVDEAGEETFNADGSRSFYLKWSSAESGDGKLSVSVVENLPEDSYISIDEVSGGEKELIEKANISAGTDPRLRALSNEGFIVRLRDKDTDGIIDAGDVISDITIKYDDADNDGYIDRWGVGAQHARLFRLRDGRWQLASFEQAVNRDENSVTARGVRGLSLFALQLYNGPHELLGEVRNFPNPFRAGEEETEIVYVLNEDSKVSLNIYTMAGDLVYREKIRPGDEGGGKGAEEGFTNRFYWDGRNGRGAVVADGIYILSVSAEGKTSARTSEKRRLIGVLK